MTISNELLASQKMLGLMEAANRQTESLLDDFPSVYALMDDQGRIIRANTAYCRLCNTTLDGALESCWYSLFTTESLDIAKHHVKKLVMTEPDHPDQQTTSQFRADVLDQRTQKARQYVWSLSRLAPTGLAGRVFFSIIGKDCSGLYESEMKLTSIFDALPLAILLLDAEGRIEDVLTQFSFALLARNNLAGQHLVEVLPCLSTHDAEDLALSCQRLSHCVGKSVLRFKEAEPYLLKQFGLKSQQQFATKWLKASYQVVSTNGIVEKFMLILQDDTESIKIANDRKRINELERQSREMYECAIRDPLTGLYTRLYMNDGFGTLLNAFNAGNINALELVLFDIDHFKRINDTYGHTTGDDVISALGKLILEETHTGMVAVRYGGDEFLIMLPEDYSGSQRGLHFAERVRERILSRQIPIKNGQSLQVTLSGGVIFCRQGETLHDMIERADAYLYRAKEAGRNTIMTEPPTPPAPHSRSELLRPH